MDVNNLRSGESSSASSCHSTDGQDSNLPKADQMQTRLRRNEATRAAQNESASVGTRSRTLALMIAAESQANGRLWPDVWSEDWGINSYILS